MTGENTSPSFRETILNLSPAGYWRLGDSGGTAFDSSGNNIHGTYGGTHALVSGLVGNDSDGARSFGTDGSIALPSGSTLDITGDITLVAIVDDIPSNPVGNHIIGGYQPSSP
jgi:hypothetical protein